MPISTPSVVYATLVCTLLNLSAWAQEPAPLPPRSHTTRPDSVRRLYQAEHLRRTRDPALGRVPSERLSAIRQQLDRAAGPQRLARMGGSTATWTERGPLGYTGTLRTLLADPADSTGHRVWAGSTTGGLWVLSDLTNATARWQLLSNGWTSQAISVLAGDPQNTRVLYAATGDYGDDVPGSGIWKSTDGGVTWAVLPATVPAQTGTSVATAFRIISGLVVTKTGLLLAGTNGGVLRSADKGVTWQTVLVPPQNTGNQGVAKANRVSAIRLGKDALVYAAMATGQLFRSTTEAATTWTDITPPNAVSSAGFRTELIVTNAATQTGQLLFAAQIAKAGTGYTLRWLQKSADNGTTWQAMTHPTYPDIPDLDVTLGFGDQYFTLTAAPDSARTLYLTAYDRLYQSDDEGKSWSAGQLVGRTTAYLPMGKRGAIWGSDNSVLYDQKQKPTDNQSIDPSFMNRTAGFGGLAVIGVALPNIAANAARLVGSADEPGLLETPGPDGTPGSVQVSYGAYPLRPFIDQDEPTVQVATTTNGGFLTRNTDYSAGWDYFSAGFGAGDFPDGGVDYDSRTNTLFFWSNTYRKATGIGTDPVISPLGSTTLARPVCLKVGASANTLLVATINGELYKWAKLDQNAPLLTKLDGGTFPKGSTISSIDVGRTDSVLVVTLANYGVSSVWSTTNGGATWQNKDLPNSGLPDMPIYAARMNPSDPKQVMLATELGIWSTADITAANPAWTLSGTTTPLVRFTQLAYRPADGRLVAASAGRGLWETDAWTPAPPALMAGTLPATALCAGSTFPLAFTLANAPATVVLVRLSDATGSFSGSTTLAGGSSSPLSVTLPADLAAGTGYRLRLEAPALGLTTVISNTLIVNTILAKNLWIADRRQLTDARLALVRYPRGYTCPGDSALLRAQLTSQPTDPAATYRWAIDGRVLTGKTAATLLTAQTGTYAFTVTTNGCTAATPTGFLLIAANAPVVNVVQSANMDNGPTCPGTAQLLGTSYLGQRAVYQWLKDNITISKSTSAVQAATATGGYAYSVSFGGTSGCAATAPATYLTFSSAILPPTVSVVNDVLPTLCGADSIGLTVARQADSTRYQWLRDGQVMASQAGASIRVGQAGRYSVQVRRGACLATSDPVSVSASGQLSNGFYFYGSTTFCEGETLVFYAKNTAHALQWTKNGLPIAGATGFSYAAVASGQYGLRYVSGACSGTAAGVTVTASQTLTPTLLLSEQCASVDLSTRDFPAAGNVLFTWLKNGQSVAQGTRAYQTVSVSGIYSVSVTNGICGGVSKPVGLTIGQPAKPVVRAVGGLVRCTNSALELNRVSGPYSYWQRNGLRIAGATSDKLIAYESGSYKLIYEQGSCRLASDSVVVTLGQPAQALLPAWVLIRSGQSAVLPVQLTGAGPWSFSVLGGPVVVNTFQNPYSLTLTPSRSTSYSLVGVTNGCGAGVGSTGRVFVDGADVSLSTWVNKRFGRLGDAVTYFVKITNDGPDMAEGLTLMNRLPAGLQYVSGVVPLPDTIRYVMGDLPAGQSRTLSFQARANRAGLYRNAVEVVACTTPDPDSQPNTGTADGEDDTALADFRAALPARVDTLKKDTVTYVADSPNPNGRILPIVAGNQPTPVSGKADLSLLLFLSKRVATARRDTIRVTMQVQNRGGAATAYVQLGLSLPNGTYSLDKVNWRPAGVNLPVDLGPVGKTDVVSRTILWLPTATGTCRAEVIQSTLPDPNSTPNNHATRPGEDDEGSADIRVR